MSDSLQPRGLYPTKLLCPQDSPGQNTGVGYHFLLQGIFPTQGSNLGFPHWRQMLYPLSHQGSPTPPLPRCQCSKESIDIPTSSSINGLAFLGTDSRAGPRLVSTLNPLCLGIPKLVIATQFFPDLLVQWLAAHRTLRRGLELGQH